MAEPSDHTSDERAVLVVEDEFTIALEFRSTLLAGGFRVMGPAASVEDALDLIGSGRPDVAVLDVRLDREVVTPVARRLKAMAVPFVLATSLDADELREVNGDLAGVFNFGKPTDLEHLVAVLRRLSQAP